MKATFRNWLCGPFPYRKLSECNGSKRIGHKMSQCFTGEKRNNYQYQMIAICVTKSFTNINKGNG